MVTRSADPQLGIRLPTSLKERLRTSADANRRSMNSELIVLLEQVLPENEKTEAAVSAATPA